MNPRPPVEHPALQLLEEAFATLRGAPFSTLLCFYAGALPFIIALLYFWADMSAGAFAEDDVVPGSLWLAVLFIWMKCWHSLFMTGLLRHLEGAAPAPWSFSRLLRLILSQSAIQPWGLLLRPVTAQLLVPYPWAKAYYETALVFHDGQPPRPRTEQAKSLAIARLWTRQNSVMLSILFLFGLIVWANIAVAAIALPMLLKTFLGLETVFTRGGFSVLNTTLLMATIVTTWLCTNPLLKAAYVIRCHRGRSLQSGEDLRIALRKLRSLVLSLLSS